MFRRRKPQPESIEAILVGDRLRVMNVRRRRKARRNEPAQPGHAYASIRTTTGDEVRLGWNAERGAWCSSCGSGCIHIAALDRVVALEYLALNPEPANRSSNA